MKPLYRHWLLLLAALVGKVSGGHAAAVEAVAAAEATTGGKYNIGKGKDHGQPAGERERNKRIKRRKIKLSLESTSNQQEAVVAHVVSFKVYLPIHPPPECIYYCGVNNKRRETIENVAGETKKKKKKKRKRNK